jgi:hypothetical protein
VCVQNKLDKCEEAMEWKMDVQVEEEKEQLDKLMLRKA